ncbi:MAG TPA: penicillin-binding transpeptidase domain-containing protein, partial [Candidatus Polarisedimenticolia bacterium]
HLPFEGQVLDRLTIFSMLPWTADEEKRRRLFLAQQPIWNAVNGRNGPDSPYRTLVRLSAAKMRQDKTTIEGRVQTLGVDGSLIEGWLVQVLEAWKESNPDTMIEPWDFAFRNGAASRALSSRVSLAQLRTLNERYYRDLGADPAGLGVQYDLEPRAGKDPVAFTTFGIRPHPDGASWSPGEPCVFAAYRVGGIDNLAELLHETGHAVHIAAIRGRPAFVDWPDSDTFTEAIADIAALEVDEPAWQRKYLGAEVPLAQSLSAKYAGIVMDVAWALFEIRMHRDPASDPNQVWTAITRDYFRIRPHPELSWWAVRGQLINAPGYMLNYAAGAILIADLRTRAKERHGAFAEGDPSWYAFMSENLYRFGLAKSSRQVIEEFLGRPVTPAAILDDMRRARSGAPPPDRKAAGATATGAAVTGAAASGSAFGPFRGSFVLFDVKSGRTERINEARAAERLSPCSTFKILNSLIGLETGVIKDADFVIPWDHVTRSRAAWNQDHTLRSAIEASVVPYYQELARRVGMERMRQSVRAVHYGNEDLSGGIDRFWLDSSLLISADEQVAFLTRLYKNELPFSRRSIDIVKEILPRIQIESDDGAVLRGKTGSGIDEARDLSLGWFVGYLERGGDAAIFAINIRGTRNQGADGMKARDITLRLVKERRLL